MVVRYGYGGHAQEILSHYTYWLPLYRAPMQVNIFLKFQEFSTLTSRSNWPAYGQTLYLQRTVALPYRNRSWRLQPCIYKSCGDLTVWWTTFKIGHFAQQLPDFTYISPNLNRLPWLNYACQWLPNYVVGRHGYGGHAQEILSHYTYWLPLYRAPMQVNKFLKFQEFSTLTSRCNWPAWGQTLYLHRKVALSYWNRSWSIQPCIYKSFGDLTVWWTTFKIGHFAQQLPDFTYISPKFDRLPWLNYACQCLPNYVVGRYGYGGHAQDI